MTVIYKLKEMLDAMVEDDYEEAANKAEDLASVLREDGCPKSVDLIHTLRKAAQHYAEYNYDDDELEEELDFDPDSRESSYDEDI